MTNYTFIVTGSYSVVIAVIIGLIRLPWMHRAYQPFITVTMASFANEMVSHMLIMYTKSNAAAINVFGLFDALLWMWQFRRWTRQYKRQQQLCTLMMLLAVLWIVENVVLQKLFSFGSLYAVTFSFVMVILSANYISSRAVLENDNALTGAKFLICCGAIIFYTYRILVECFSVDHYTSNSFLAYVFSILASINLIVNLLFAVAIIWIPGKQKFSLPYY